MPDLTSDTGRMERDLAQTRARLGSHLNELQDRLSPGQVLDDLMRYFRGSEGAEFGRSLLDSVHRGVSLADGFQSSRTPGSSIAREASDLRTRRSGRHASAADLRAPSRDPDA